MDIWSEIKCILSYLLFCYLIARECSTWICVSFCEGTSSQYVLKCYIIVGFLSPQKTPHVNQQCPNSMIPHTFGFIDFLPNLQMFRRLVPPEDQVKGAKWDTGFLL